MATTDREITRALCSLISETNLNPSTDSINGVVEQLQSKLNGLDLTDRMEFIHAQIDLLFQQPPQQPQATNENCGFTLQQSTNSVPAHSPAQPIELPPKESAQITARRRFRPGGFSKLCGVSPQLEAIVGHPTLPRTEIVKQLWAYIRKNNLQDPRNKRKIICNDELRLVFETDSTDMFKTNKLLAKHIFPLEPKKESGTGRQTADHMVSGKRSAEPGPSVMISDALANFMGVSVGEMLQSEILGLLWEYINVNNLEDPLNPMVILCDAKLQNIFGCDSISALAIPEGLARHISRR